MMTDRRECLAVVAGCLGLTACTNDNMHKSEASPVLTMPFSPESNSVNHLDTQWPGAGEFSLRVSLEKLPEVDSTSDVSITIAGVFSLHSDNDDTVVIQPFRKKSKNLLLGFSMANISLSASEAKAITYAQISIGEDTVNLLKYYSTGTLHIKRKPLFQFLD